MAKSLEILIESVRSRIHQLLYDDVIEQTIVVMRELRSDVKQLSETLLDKQVQLTDSQKEDLQTLLLSLYSESIREALHKGELPITNSIIREKNRILTQLGVPIPEGHHEINPADYPDYTW